MVYSSHFYYSLPSIMPIYLRKFCVLHNWSTELWTLKQKKQSYFLLNWHKKKYSLYTSKLDFTAESRWFFYIFICIYILHFSIYAFSVLLRFGILQPFLWTNLPLRLFSGDLSRYSFLLLGHLQLSWNITPCPTKREFLASIWLLRKKSQLRQTNKALSETAVLRLLNTFTH